MFSTSNTDLNTARAKIAEQVKIDVLSKTQTLDNEDKLREVSRSFISDTLTVPTKEMYAYAALSSLGDDVYHEPSTLTLEAHIAQLTGKEAALFLPTGTMSNQIALRTHLLQPPYSVLCDHRAHINKYEAGGAAFHSGASIIAVVPSNGHHLTLEDVKQNVVTETDVHFAPTEVIELENTLGGAIFPQDEIRAIAAYAREQRMKMHLDGARIWHVAAETGTSLKELCEPFDSVSMCFSKGLGAPIGTCLIGSKTFIAKARWLRKLFGGGMRQTGYLCGAAAYALSHNFSLLPGVHALAKRLEQGLIDIGAKILIPAETCMVFFDPSSIGVDHTELAKRAAELPNPIGLGGSRLVVHIQTSPEAVDDLLTLVRQLAEEKEAAGFVGSEAPVNGVGATRNTYVRVRK